MELLLVFLSTAVGTVVGVVAAVLMMNRRNRAPAVSDAALRTQLQNTEWALASAGKDVEDLRKQLGERESVREELERTQQQLVAIVADKEKQSTERAAAEQRLAQLSADVAGTRERAEAAETLLQRVVELEAALAASAQQTSALTAEAAGMRERLEASETAAQRAVELEATLAATGQRASDTTAELEAAVAAAEQRTTAAQEEISNLRQGLDVASATAQRVMELEAALHAAEQRELEAANDSCALRERIEQLVAQANTAGSGVAESERRIASLEAEVRAFQAQAVAERERHQRAASDAANLEDLLRKERQSAVEAMELLSQAQDKFSGVFAAAAAQ